MVNIIINGADAFTRYGISLSTGGFSALRKPAPNKPFIESKRRTQHGKSVIRNNPKKDERDLVLPINMTASSESDFLAKYDLFVTEVLDTGFVEIVTSSQPTVAYKCEYKDCQQYQEFMQGMAKFMLLLTETNPKDRIPTVYNQNSQSQGNT